jgi:thiol:disulfide interchange protein DsbD
LALLTLLAPATAFAEDGGSASNAFTAALARGPFFAVAAAFVGGLLVSLTPCVYPMIAITVSVFGAKQSKSRLHAAGLSAPMGFRTPRGMRSTRARGPAWL